MAVKAMAESPAQMSNEYSGALWEIGDFLFAAKSIAKIAHGKGSWGDAFNVGISAATLFIPPLKLGKLATPALKAVVAESEKMLATEVVSTVGKKQLQHTINNANRLIEVPEAARPRLAQQLHDGTYQITDLMGDTAITRQGGVPKQVGGAIRQEGGVVKGAEMETLGLKEHPMPPENVVSPREPYKMESAPTSAAETEPADFSSWLTDAKHDSKRKAYVKIKRDLLDGSVKRSDLTADEQRIVEVFDHYRNPKNKIKVTLTDSDGNKYPGYMYSPFREPVKQPLGAGGAEREFDFATFYEEKVAELESIVEARKYHETRLSKLQDELADPEIKEGLSNVIKKEMQQSVKVLEKLLPQDKELMNWLRGTWDSYFKKATADKGLTDISDVTLSDSHLSKEIIEQIKGKTPAAPESMLASGKSAIDKFTPEAKRARAKVEQADAADFRKQNALREEERDILTAEEARDAGLVERYGSDYDAQRRMDTTRIEDLPPHLQEKAEPINYRRSSDATKELEVTEEFLMKEAPVRGTARVKELEQDLSDLKERAVKLTKLLKENPGLFTGKASKVKELAKTNKQIKEARAALRKARGEDIPNKQNASALAAADEKRFLETARKLLVPTVTTKAFGTTKAETLSLWDRLAKVDGLLTEEGRLRLFNILRKNNKSEKQAQATIERYEKERERLKAAIKDNEDKFLKTISKLTDESKAKLAVKIDALDEKALKQIALRQKSVYAQEQYLLRLRRLTGNPETTARIDSIIDKLDLKPTPGGDKIFKAAPPKKVVQPARPDRAADDEILVFGSNLEGRHGAGTALEARNRFGAKYGQARGPQGNAYAIATKDLKTGKGLELSDIKKEIDKFLDYADANPDKNFFFSAIATGRAGHTPEDIAKLISRKPDNVRFDPKLGNLIGKKTVAKAEDVVELTATRAPIDKSYGTVVRLKKLDELGLKASDVVDIGRSGKFGNPYPVSGKQTVNMAVEKYRNWLWKRIKEDPEYAKELYGLKGKTLACPGGESDAGCHGQVILRAIKYLEEHPELMKGK